MRHLAWLLLCFGLLQPLTAQEYFPKNDGLKQEDHNYTAFKNVTLHISPEKVINNGVLLVQDGKVVASGRSVNIPDNCRVIDLSGKHIYPSFIEPYTDFGMSKPKKAERQRNPQYEAKRQGYYWNDHIIPDRNGIASFNYDEKAAEKMRKAGFGVANTHVMDGIARGTGVLVALNDQDGPAKRILSDRSGQFFSFSKSVTSRQSYPGSLMGSMALLRQLHHDINWYKTGASKTKDRAIEAMIDNSELPSFFYAGDKGNDLRADGIADAFGLNYIIVGGGDEYESIEQIKASNAGYILPLNFPKAYDVTDPYAASYVSIEDMRNWNQAPTNPKILSENEVAFSLTTHKLKDVGTFMANLRKAIKYGLDEADALAAVTTVPAAQLEAADRLGTLDAGKEANFLITSGPIFDKSTIIYENWVQGKAHVISDMTKKEIDGNYALNVAGNSYQLEISGTANKPKLSVKKEEDKVVSKISYDQGWLTISITDEGTYRMQALIDQARAPIAGQLTDPKGSISNFVATRTGDITKKEDKKDKKEQPEVVAVTYPNVGYGFTSLPQANTYLFKNATVWTSEDAGIIENTDVLVKDGKIASIGTDLSASGATVIDATGKHLTAGIIDEHSHIAALSINEGGHNSSAEVSIEDVIDPEDMNIYRNVAGGVTTIQILHGSANPIGGRSAIIKLKWGETAQGLIFPNSPKFIKFALGENVKQSNWQSYSRFPQTRMGVEQVMVNYFTRAQEYDTKKKSGAAYRYDEEMEVLAEILNGERFISCHSYVQSEINMLMKVAERFGFRINTFTHILEGYKVADKMKAHGVGGSTFSDWWAYKYEVNDAIPYNAAIMAKVGVTVAINSDDDEMSRRLNQEAAKGVKYGGMSEEEAWKMVTINPAKLLHLDEKVGSIKEGKDADLVLWSAHPLSVYAKAEKTLIEGAVYFDLEADKRQREAIKAERAKLIGMMLEEKSGGGKTQPPKKKDKIDFHCETIN